MANRLLMSLSHRQMKAEWNKLDNFWPLHCNISVFFAEGGVLMNQAGPAFPRRQVMSGVSFKDGLTILEVRAHSDAVSFSHAYGGLR